MGKAWCLRLGMSSSAWDGWAEQHVNPFVAIRYFFGSAALSRAAAAYICTGVRGHDHMYYVVMVPLVFYVVVLTGADCCYWRWGPEIVHHKLYQTLMALASLCMLPTGYVGFWGPDATVPWNSRFYFICVDAVFTFFVLQAASAGGVPGEHPTEPRTSIMGPCTRSALQALMVLDAASDLALLGPFCLRHAPTGLLSSQPDNMHPTMCLIC